MVLMLVVIATGNDFRAIEACGHTYASKSRAVSEALTHVDIKDGQFKFWIEIPIAVGTIGGLTALHPMVKFSHQLLGNPNAQDLMKINGSSRTSPKFWCSKIF